MEQITCPSCNTELKEQFRFCPNCGYDLNKPIVCPNCHYENESNSKFCQECGTALLKSNDVKTKPKKAEPAPDVILTIEDPPRNGITVEFPYSTAQSFDFAVASARQFPTFKQFGTDKKAIYRVTVQPGETNSLADLLEHLKGWRKRTVYVDGEKVTWESVFSFRWCYEKKKASFKPEYYCFGYENEWEFNVWGCIQAHLPFISNAQWCNWGKWVNNKGDWEFDKERIRHELQKNLYSYRFCPALRPELITDVLNAFPDVVNPAKDKNWEFVESWGDDSVQGLKVITTRFGYKEEVVMKGVAPKGKGAIKDMAKRMKYSLPSFR